MGRTVLSVNCVRHCETCPNTDKLCRQWDTLVFSVKMRVPLFLTPKTPMRQRNQCRFWPMDVSKKRDMVLPPPEKPLCQLSRSCPATQKPLKSLLRRYLRAVALIVGTPYPPLTRFICDRSIVCSFTLLFFYSFPCSNVIEGNRGHNT